MSTDQKHDWSAWDRDYAKARGILDADVDAWKSGETYLYQEPEPVHRWPTVTRWGRFRARVRLWFRRLSAKEFRL